MSTFKTLKELVLIDSPSGYTHHACKYIFELLESYGYQPTYTAKGAVKCALGENPSLVIAAHVDTLGAMVSGINADGTLGITKLGGPLLSSFDSEYCRIKTLDDKEYTGTLLLNNPSTHANRKVDNADRTINNMHIRLDELVNNKEEVEKLGIGIGDVICFDTRYQEMESGFIKSRFMDNKAGCYVLFEIARRMKEAGKSAPVELFFSNYEEVGHGAAAGYAPTVNEMICIDMGVLGKQCAGRETHCSICAKDSTGPYDYNMRKELTLLARKNDIPHKVDVYPYYGSDGSAALRAGHDFRVSLIGPGVAASHGMERTHKQGIEATIDLCMAYINDKF